MKYLIVAFFLFSISTLADSETKTEAGFTDLHKSSNFCCDREVVQESAHDMSQEESLRIVRTYLAPKARPTRPSLPPARRGLR